MLRLHVAAPFDADRIPMANVVVGRLAAFVEGTYGNLPVAVDELPLHVTADAREAAVQRRQIVIGVGVVNTQEFPGDCSDIVGSEMVVIEVAKMGDVLERTWAALVAVCTADGQLFFRAFRGTRISKLVQLTRAMD